MSNTQQILAALQSALTGDAKRTAGVPASQIGNHLKDEAPFPHILFSLDAEDAGVKPQLAYTMTLTLDVWTAYRGEAQVWEINDLIGAVLDRNPLTIASGSMTYLNFASLETSTEDDGRTRLGKITYNLMVTE